MPLRHVLKTPLKKMCRNMLKATSMIVKSVVGRGHGYRRCEEHVWHSKWAAPKVEKIICGRLPRINEYMANIGLCIYPIVTNYTRMLCVCTDLQLRCTLVHSGIIVLSITAVRVAAYMECILLELDRGDEGGDKDIQFFNLPWSASPRSVPRW